jgi:hypothetical protein
LVETNQFDFDYNLAKSVVPDLGYQNGKYVSLFAPGVSLLALPGYVIGKMVGLSQVGVYLVIALISVLNGVLIVAISRKLGAHPVAAMLGAGIFLFATPAFVYAVSLFQHQVTVFLMLVSMWLLLSYTGWWAMAMVWILLGFSVSVDYPNVLFMMPIGIWVVSKMVDLRKLKDRIVVRFNTLRLLTWLAILLPAGVFLGYNTLAYGNPLQIASTVKTVRTISEDGTPRFSGRLDFESDDELESLVVEKKKTAVGFLKTRQMLRGFSVLTVGWDRGVVWFTPVLGFAIVGGLSLYRKRAVMLNLLLAIVGLNVVFYSMWGDPWGGWAFGPRYLVPSMAMGSILLGIGLTELRNKRLWLSLFTLLMVYSVGVNTLGAITTRHNPPKIEVAPNEKFPNMADKYTYLVNWNYVREGNSKSFVYRIWANQYVSTWQYYLMIVGGIVGVNLVLVMMLYISSKKKGVSIPFIS